MKLNTLFNFSGSKKRRKRIGRGIGSGSGKTCGRGVKGQKSRSGVTIKTEGGQMPLIKRLPKRGGVNSLKSVNYTIISIADIEVLIGMKRIDATKSIDKDTLMLIGYIKNNKVPVKLLGGVDRTAYKLIIKLDACSESAKSVIEKAGGKII